MRLAPTVPLVFALSLPLAAASAQARDLAAELRFEAEHPGETPAGWGGGPAETLHLDGEVVHGGEWSVRLERDAASPGRFSTLTRGLPADVDGRFITWRGWLRTEDVEGHCGLWLRQDGESGVVGFDNMAGRGPTGTTDWTQHTIVLPLSPDARDIAFGVLLSGTGRIWADDLELLVDGRPIALAPKRAPETSILTTDTEFAKGSGITLAHSSPAQVESLVLFGKVWGFLKYHHPKATRGELHWDHELFRVMPSMLAAGTPEQRRKALLDWLKRLGPLESCAPCAEPPENAHLLPRLDWLSDEELLGSELSHRLLEVHRHRPAGGEQFWVGQVKGPGNPDFGRERSYPELLESPDPGYQLLALLRTWNVVEWWFPYRDLIEEDWDRVLRETIPTFLAAKDRSEYRRALLRFVARVHDTHANVRSALDDLPPIGDARLPADLRFLDGHAVVWRAPFSPAAQPDQPALRLGDVLLEIDGRKVDALVAEWSPWYAASNEPTRLRDLAAALTHGPAGPVRVVVDRDGERKELVLERVARGESSFEPRRGHDRDGEAFQELGEEVGYMKLSAVTLEGLPDWIERARGKRGLVIDIRNYPGAFTVFALGSHLVARHTPFVRFTASNLANPGAFTWTEPLVLAPAAPRIEGRIAILVDETTQSQAEYTAMAFRTAPGAVVVGGTTAGADGNVSAIPLPGGERTMISGLGVFYPDRRPTQRVGIVPDLVVGPTREGIRDGRDEVLEAALRALLGEQADEAEIRRLATWVDPERRPVR